MQSLLLSVEGLLEFIGFLELSLVEFTSVLYFLFIYLFFLSLFIYYFISSVFVLYVYLGSNLFFLFFLFFLSINELFTY